MTQIYFNNFYKGNLHSKCYTTYNNQEHVVYEQKLNKYKRALKAMCRSPEEKVTVEPFTEDHYKSDMPPRQGAILY